jgi:hypothetical protein
MAALNSTLIKTARNDALYNFSESQYAGQRALKKFAKSPEIAKSQVHSDDGSRTEPSRCGDMIMRFGSLSSGGTPPS